MKTAALTRSIEIDAPPDEIWEAMIDPPRWNPGFAHATVTVVAGEQDTVGEVEHIRFSDGAGGIVDALYAEIIRLEDGAHITWFVTPATEPEHYRNFLDFELLPRSGGALFRIHYFLQSDLSGSEFAAYRAAQAELLISLTAALKSHLEGASRVS